jgi:hypothetical protein
MKESDLRIGNIVSGFDGKSFAWSLEDFKMLADSNVDADELCMSIPLTEEWLRAVGLHKYNVHNDPSMFNYCTDGLDNLDVVGTTDCGDSFYSVFGNEIEIKYVHQLQNLYFALTGTELKIK